MSSKDEQQNTGGGAPENAPPVVLPSPNTQSIGGQTLGFPTSAVIGPQPIVRDMDAPGDEDLAGRVEQTLAEDGRFAAFVTGLVVITGNGGRVTISGPIPSEGQRHGLIAAVQSVPGVSEVSDETTVG